MDEEETPEPALEPVSDWVLVRIAQKNIDHARKLLDAYRIKYDEIENPVSD